jgi:ribosomal protein S18 acetylase RimI-like enzyme
MENIIIREADLMDVMNLSVLKQQVWIATYALEGIRNEFSVYVLTEFTPENVRKEVIDSNKLIYIAEIDHHILGCVEIEFDSKCPVKSEKGPEISVLYVLERFTGMGIGQQLLDKAFMLCKELSIDSVWLTVYLKNERAINFYQKNKFRESGMTYFELVNNRYENRIMTRKIQ